ncbi:MAG TPA: response regulator transcription factor [Salinarimonas sp.]|jgi:two-component system response regulator TctD|nr:response regulator transcription factor [Salinarimonas sp.]
MRLLLIEDTPDLGEAMQTALHRAGHAVDWVLDGNEAEERLAASPFDLVVLDISLPGRGGFEILSGLRARADRTPVLVVTARSQIDDKVGLLDLGADDYLVKPFDLRELEARVRALLRRPLGMPASAVRHGNVTFDAAARAVRVDDRPIDLSRREFRLLEVLIGRMGALVAKDRLIEHLFGADEEVSPNAVELYVSRLRKKLGTGASIEIATARGEGYVARCRPGP